jgi:hypothetical protein
MKIRQSVSVVKLLDDYRVEKAVNFFTFQIGEIVSEEKLKEFMLKGLTVRIDKAKAKK